MSNYIPEEILIKILSKLPVKSLIRFTRVCKAWQSLIVSPFFISLHLSNTESQILLSYYNNNQLDAVVPKREPFSLKVIDTPLKCPIKYYRIVGSCDGLVCFSKYMCFSNDPRPPVIVWNPTIRKQVVLPQSFTINKKKVDDVLLGFGVASNVYKVVRLVYYKKSHIAPPRAEIFTLGTRMWRKLSDGIDAYTGHPYQGYSWFFKGFLHWIVCVCESTTDGNECMSIMTFHVGDEVFGEIVLPEELKRETSVVSLAIIGESFGAISYFLENGLRCNVWIMKDYGVTESWTKLYRIDYNGFKRVIGFLENNELLLGLYNNFVTYNAKTKGIKHVGNFGEIFCSWYVDDFKESLVLLEGSYSGELGEESSLSATSTISC